MRPRHRFRSEREAIEWIAGQLADAIDAINSLQERVDRLEREQRPRWIERHRERQR